MENILEKASIHGGKRMFWIDVLRVMLCMGVVVYHYTPERPSSGPMCVDGFFVLSGFLLALGFSRMEARGGMDVRAFYKSKAGRLLPTFMASLVLGAVYVLLNSEMTFLPGGLGSDFRLFLFLEHYNVPSWYMVCELAFIGFAPLLYYLYGMGKPAVFVLLSLTAAFSACLYAHVPYASPFGNGLYFQPQVRLWQFVAGMFAAMFFLRFEFIYRMKTAVYALLGMTAAMLAVLCVVKQYSTLCFLNYTFWFDACMILLFMLLIPGLARLESPLSTKICSGMAYAAALTYPVYLYHVPVYNWIGRSVGKVFGLGLPPVVAGVVSALATLLLSALSLRYLDGFFARKKARTAVSASK